MLLLYILTPYIVDDISSLPSSTSKPVKSWKHNKSIISTPNKSSSNQPSADELHEINTRKAAELDRINQLNEQMASDLLGGFTIKTDSVKLNPASSNTTASTTAHDITDTITSYPLTKDDDYDQFASKIAHKLLQNKSNASTVLFSQRLLRFSKSLCKQLCSDSSMRLDEVNLLKSYLAVLHSDKAKNIPRKQQSKPIAQNTKLPQNAQLGIAKKQSQSSAARNLYHDDELVDDDEYDDIYDNNDDFM